MNKTNTQNRLKDILSNLFNNYNYSYLYISIGGKQNEERVNFTYPNNNLTLSSHAEFQMVPQFIRREPEDKIIVVVIDDFHDEHLEKQTIDILNNCNKTHPNIVFVLVDHILTIESISIYLNAIIDSIEHKLQPEQLMIANFICFKQPSLKQSEFENNISIQIQKQIDVISSGKYSACFYQWYYQFKKFTTP